MVFIVHKLPTHDQNVNFLLFLHQYSCCLLELNSGLVCLNFLSSDWILVLSLSEFHCNLVLVVSGLLCSYFCKYECARHMKRTKCGHRFLEAACVLILPWNHYLTLCVVSSIACACVCIYQIVMPPMGLWRVFPSFNLMNNPRISCDGTFVLTLISDFLFLFLFPCKITFLFSYYIWIIKVILNLRWAAF